jgi:IclR family acetate operon transcriptional repressor
VCIDSIPSTQSIVSVASVGAVWPAHTCSSGLAFLATDDAFRDEYLEQPLSRPTDQTITDRDELRKMLQEFKSLGYAVNLSYWRDGVCAVGAVVHDAAGKPVAALSVMMPEFRLEENGVETLGKLVVDVADRASARLGYRGPLSAV